MLMINPTPSVLACINILHKWVKKKTLLIIYFNLIVNKMQLSVQNHYIQYII